MGLTHPTLNSSRGQAAGTHASKGVARERRARYALRPGLDMARATRASSQPSQRSNTMHHAIVGLVEVEVAFGDHAVTEVDRLDTDAQEQARFLCRPCDVHFLGSDTPANRRSAPDRPSAPGCARRVSFVPLPRSSLARAMAIRALIASE